MPAILEGLPQLYRSMLPELFRREVPPETKATCDRCAMCAGGAQGAVASVDGVSRLFRPDTKCCTFQPRLPNYLVGAILSDSSPALGEGRRRIEATLDRRIGLGPQWLRPPAKFSLLYGNSRQFFGRTESLRCPYFEQTHGQCSIWPYREAVCSTFFCKHSEGADGRQFWMSLKTYLTLAEIQLSRWALLQLFPEFLLARCDREDPTGKPLSPEDLDDRPIPESAHRKVWRDWAGRERELYRACYEQVRALSAEDLPRMLGLDGTLELAVLEKLYRAVVDPVLPAVLKLNPSATMSWLPDGSLALGSYSEYDAVALPGAAYELLIAFTGLEPVDAVRARLRRERSADLDEAVLLTLYRQRVLVEP